MPQWHRHPSLLPDRAAPLHAMALPIQHNGGLKLQMLPQAEGGAPIKMC